MAVKAIGRCGNVPAKEHVMAEKTIQQRVTELEERLGVLEQEWQSIPI